MRRLGRVQRPRQMAELSHEWRRLLPQRSDTEKRLVLPGPCLPSLTCRTAVPSSLE